MLLSTDNLVVRAPGAGVVLAGVSLSIENGEVVVLVGPSGCGKTTLAHCLVGLRAPDSGIVSVNGVRIELIPRARRRALVQLLIQDPFAGLNPRRRVASQLAEVAEHGQGEIDQLLRDLGLPSPEKKKPVEFSGGERQRFGLLRALLRRPAFLVADEPTSALDPDRKRAVVVQLAAIARDRGMGLLIITHEPQYLAGLHDRMLALSDGRLAPAG